MINLAVDLPLQIRHFFRPLVHQQQDKNNLGIICLNRFRNFLQQDGLAHSRRRNDEAALPATERRQQIDRARANGVRVRVLQDNSALRKLRCELVERCRLLPFLAGLILNLCNLVERQELLALYRQSHRAGNFLPGPQIVLLNQCTRNGHILGNRQEI